MRFLSIKSSAMLLVLSSIDDSGGGAKGMVASGGGSPGMTTPGSPGPPIRKLFERRRGETIKRNQVEQVMDNYNQLVSRGDGTGLRD